MNSKLFLITVAAALAATGYAQPALKDAFQKYFRVGAALNEAQFTGANAAEAALVKKQFNTISPENVLKWEAIHPQRDQYNFIPGDHYVAFGETNQMFIIGHTLVWHSQTPDWVFQNAAGQPADRTTLLNTMSNHIATIVGRYKGRIKGWDVVNEALADDGTLRQSPWLKIIGEDYLVKAYEFAHAADPDAELYYNDYSIENEPKRSGVIALIKKLQAAGIHITAAGIQEHVHLNEPTAQQVDEAITAFGRLGVKVNITELDVDVLPAASPDAGADVGLRVRQNPALNPFTNGLPNSVQQALAKRYAELFAVYLKHSHEMNRVTFWGVTDANSWLNDWPVNGRVNYPLLFDRRGKIKPAYVSVIKIAAPTKSAGRNVSQAESLAASKPSQ